MASVYWDALDGAYLSSFGVVERGAGTDPDALLASPRRKCLLIGVLDLKDVTQGTVLS